MVDYTFQYTQFFEINGIKKFISLLKTRKKKKKKKKKFIVTQILHAKKKKKKKKKKVEIYWLNFWQEKSLAKIKI